MKTFVVLGYGIPKKMEADENYRSYLGMAFNTIYTQTQQKNESATIVFCGGPTDMYKPYKRVEAQEMSKFFRSYADRSVCRIVTKTWKYFLEKKSLSTLENLVYAKHLLDQKKIDISSLTIFCEVTREKRIKRLAKKVFGKANIIAIDFDISENRYIDPKLIEQKEREAIKLDTWTLARPERLKQYRKLFVDKMTFLRKAGPGNHQAALREWWKKRLDQLQ